MLKLNPADVPFAVQNEAFFIGLARKSGLKVANYKILTDGQGQQALLLGRFDRIATKEGKQLLAAEDGCQTSNLYPADKYNIDFLQMAKRLASLCPASIVAGYELLQQLVFNWLIGNGDAHAKNFSILESAAGEWRISPAYDLLCTRFYDDRTMALSLDDKKTDWSRSLLIDLAAELKVSKKAAEAVITEQLTALADLPDQIISGALPFRRDLNYDVAAFLKQRAKALA
jgi:serine/threonine-protein kinase HipA